MLVGGGGADAVRLGSGGASEASAPVVTGRPCENGTLVDDDALRGLPRPSDPWSVGARHARAWSLDRVERRRVRDRRSSRSWSRHGDGGHGRRLDPRRHRRHRPAALGSTALYPDMRRAGRVDGAHGRARRAGAHARRDLASSPTRRRPPRGATGGLTRARRCGSSRRRQPARRARRAARSSATATGAVLRSWAASSAARSRRSASGCGAPPRGACPAAGHVHRQHEERAPHDLLHGPRPRARRRRPDTCSLLAVRAEKARRGPRRDPERRVPEVALAAVGPAHGSPLAEDDALAGACLAAHRRLAPGRRLPARAAGGRPARAPSRTFAASSSARTQQFETAPPAPRGGRGSGGRPRGGWGSTTSCAGRGRLSPQRRSTTRSRSGRANEVAGLRAAERLLPRLRPHGLRAADAGAGARARLQEGLERLRAGRGSGADAWGSPPGLRLERLAGTEPAVFGGRQPCLSGAAAGGAIRRRAHRDRVARPAAARGSVVGPADATAGWWRAPAMRPTPRRLGSGDITFDNPLGRESASLTYYWIDRDADHTVERRRAGSRARAAWAPPGSTPAAPALAVVSPHAIDAGTTRATHARGDGGARAVARAGFAPRLHLGWRRLTQPLWRPLRGLTVCDYVIRGGVQRPALRRDRTSVGYYAPASLSRIVPGNGRLLANREGYHQDVWSADAVGGRPARRPRLLAGFRHGERLARVLPRRDALGPGPDAYRRGATEGCRDGRGERRVGSAAATSSPTPAGRPPAAFARRCPGASPRPRGSTPATVSRSPISRSRTPATPRVRPRTCSFPRGSTFSACRRSSSPTSASIARLWSGREG